MLTKKEIELLFDDYLTGTLTEEGKRLFQRVLEDPAHEPLLGELLDRQQALRLAETHDYPELKEQIRTELLYTIRRSPAAIPAGRAPQQRVHRIRRRNWLAAASVLLLLVAGAWLWWQYRSNGKQEDLTETLAAGILPGQQGAVLTLGDGSQVVLDSLGNGLVASEQGAIVKLQQGALVYDAASHDRNASKEEAVAYNTMTTPKGRQFRLILPDGTRVWLNAASSLKYPTVFRGNERRVEITGEAYFEVQRRTYADADEKTSRQQLMPFIVVCHNQEVEVLGTRFNINSYEDETATRTTLQEGKIRLRLPSETKGQGDWGKIILPGQQAVAERKGSDGSQHLSVMSEVNIDKVMAWKNGLFDFEDAHLDEVMRQLERWYDIEVSYEQGVPNIEFGGKISRNISFAAILKILQDTEVHFRLEEGRKLVITP